MNKEEINVLERRNKAEQKLIHQKLDAICSTVQENHRALRGSNGDAGLVADIAIIKNDVEHHEDKINSISERRVWVNRAVIGSALALFIDILVRAFV